MGRGAANEVSEKTWLRRAPSLAELQHFKLWRWQNPDRDTSLPPHPPHRPLRSHYPDSDLQDPAGDQTSRQSHFAERALLQDRALDMILKDGVPDGAFDEPEVLRAAMAFRHDDFLVIPDESRAARNFETMLKGMSERICDAHIYRHGRRIGGIERRVARNSQGQLVVSNDSFDLDLSAQGEGLFGAFTSHFRQIARERGVVEISVVAGDTLGGYASAAPGVVFAGDPDYQRLQIEAIWQGNAEHADGGRHAARRAWEEGHYPHELFVQADRYFYALATGAAPVPTPYELAQIGREQSWQDADGRPMWLGKLILTDSYWEGRDFLTGAAGRSLIPPEPPMDSIAGLEGRRASWASSLDSTGQTPGA